MDDSVSLGVEPPSLESLTPPPATYRLKLVRVTGIIYVTRRTNPEETGSLNAMQAFYRKVQRHNALLGWWGIPFGFIWTPMALYRNSKAWKKLGEISASGTAAPGWFPDPSGRHGSRYWDGSAWTDRVGDVSTDNLPS